jgi:hypothetical protein
LETTKEIKRMSFHNLSSFLTEKVLLTGKELLTEKEPNNFSLPTLMEGGSFLNYDLLYFKEVRCGREPPTHAVIRQQVQQAAWS